MARTLEYNATLSERIDLTPQLAIFRVVPDQPPASADGGDGPWFVPGQYATIGLNREPGVDPEGDDTPASVRRPMSIASSPRERGHVELYVRYVNHPESSLPLTHLLWRRRAGARMYMRPAVAGRFTIDDTIGRDDPRTKLMIAAGTGLAPFISMARERVGRDPAASLQDMALLHGASYPADLGYRDELERLARDHGLRYVTTVSRPKEAPEWSGQAGRVEALLAPERIHETERLLGLSEGHLRPDRAAVLICGLQGTIAVTIIHMLHRGFIPDHRRIRRALEAPEQAPATLYFEQYDSTPVIDLDDEKLVAGLRADLAAALAR